MQGMAASLADRLRFRQSQPANLRPMRDGAMRFQVAGTWKSNIIRVMLAHEREQGVPSKYQLLHHLIGKYYRDLRPSILGMPS